MSSMRGNLRAGMVLGALGFAFLAPVYGQGTPYTAGTKEAATRILKDKTYRDQLDREYDGLKQDLGKTIILNSSSKEKGYDDAIHTLKRIDQAIKEYHAIKNKDLGAAAEVFGKETISILIKTLEPTQPELALGLKVLKAGTDTSIVVGKMIENRGEASKTSENIDQALKDLDSLIAKDKAYRQDRSLQAGNKPDSNSDANDPNPPAEPQTKDDTGSTAAGRPHNVPTDDFDEISRWIDGGDRSFGSEDSPEARARRDSFYARNPILEQFREKAAFRSPADEFFEAGGYAMLADPPSFDPTKLSPEEFSGWLRNQEKARQAMESRTGVRTPTDDLTGQRAQLDQGTIFPQQQAPPAVLFQGSSHSLDGGNTWVPNAGTPYENGGGDVIVDGGWHSFDKGQTWLQNQGTSFEKDLTSQRAQLDEGAIPSTALLNPGTLGPDQMFQMTEPATPMQIANAQRALERMARNAQREEQRQLRAQSGDGGGGESRWAKILPWINFGLQVLDTYNQIQAQQRAQEYQRYQAQQRAQEYQRLQAQQRAQAAAKAAGATQRGTTLAPPGSQAPPLQQAPPVSTPQSSGPCGPGYVINPAAIACLNSPVLLPNGLPNSCQREWVGAGSAITGHPAGPYIPWCIAGGK